MTSLVDPYRDAADSLLLDFLDNHPANDMGRNTRAQAAASAPTATLDADDVQVAGEARTPLAAGDANRPAEATTVSHTPNPTDRPSPCPADTQGRIAIPANTPQTKQKKPRAPRAPRAPRTPKAAPDYLDVSTVSLPGEATASVPIHDTCDTTRRNIRTALRRPGITQAAFLRAISSSSSSPNGKRVLSRGLNDFLGKKGALAGSRNYAYYAAYVFFEKVRIREGKPKSEDRLVMERKWPRGVDTEVDYSRAWLGAGESGFVLDKYGITVTY